jgi:hypothetical protein
MPVYDANGVTPRKPVVRLVEARLADSCQGCGRKHVDVFEMNCRSWITRLCIECAEFVLAEMKRLK